MDLSLKNHLIENSKNANKEKAKRILREEQDQPSKRSESGIHASSRSEGISSFIFGPNDSTLLRVLGERKCDLYDM